MSRQITPVTELMFGCQIFVANFTYTVTTLDLFVIWHSTDLMLLDIPGMQKQNSRNFNPL